VTDFETNWGLLDDTLIIWGASSANPDGHKASGVIDSHTIQRNLISDVR